jgi:YVTN family beta-propeller protein
LDASTGALIQTVSVGGNPDGISSDGTHVWVANYDDGTVSELSATTGALTQTIGVGEGPWDISSDGTHVWVVNNGDSTVSVVDASTGALAQVVPVGSNSEGISADGTHVWVANETSGSVSEIDPSVSPPAPTIAKFSPAAGAPGRKVVITGTDLSGVTKVKFHGTSAEIVSDSFSRLEVTVPAGAASGKIKVKTVYGSTKTATTFTIT